MMVGGDLEFARSSIFDGHFDAALALVSTPDTVVEAKLYFLIDVAREIIGCHPARVNIECRLAIIGIGVYDLQLHRIPGGACGLPDETTLAVTGDSCKAPPAHPRLLSPGGERGEMWTKSEID